MARTAASAAGVAVSAVIAASLIAYFVSPYELPAMFRTGGAPLRITVGSWSALTIILFLDLVALRRRFCATACPYAKIQSVLFDDRTLTVAFDDQRAEECMQCAACLKACPVGIDIRKGLQMACIHCAECVDACTERMAGRARKSLVRYAFGAPGKRTGIRMNPLITGVAAVISLVFLMYLSATRMPFDMNVRLNFAGMPEMSADGSVTNSYELSFRNMVKSDLELDLIAAAPAYVVRVSPDAVMLRRGTDIMRVPVSVTLKGLSSQTQRRMTVTLTARARQEQKSVEKTVYFMLPRKY
jgi:polyferredoxin